MRKLITLALGLLLALGALATLPAQTAGAHDYDGYATIYCEAHKSHTWQTVIHAWPYSLEPGYLVYICTQDFFGDRYQYFVRRNMNTGAHALASGYQHCRPQGAVLCGLHGDP